MIKGRGFDSGFHVPIPFLRELILIGGLIVLTFCSVTWMSENILPNALKSSNVSNYGNISNVVTLVNKETWQSVFLSHFF